MLWSEVNLDEKRITIRAERMKNRQPHSLPLSEPALAILSERALCRTSDDRVFAPPSGVKSINWTHWVTRIRVVMGEDKLERSRRFNLHDVREVSSAPWLSAALTSICWISAWGTAARGCSAFTSDRADGAKKKQPWPHGLSSSLRPSRTTMWCRSVRDDNSSSRGPDGSPRGPDGLGIPSRSAPASTSEILIDKLEMRLARAQDWR